MKKINLKAKMTLGIIISLLFLPLISGFTILRRAPQITVEIPNNLEISQAEIFDGMIVNHTFTVFGTKFNSSFNYVFDSGNNYNLTWLIPGLGGAFWVEDVTTRLISSSTSFPDGSHTPAWIFTNVSLYDIVPISVDGDGDHMFNVTKEKIFNIPGFGSVEVWQLEDLTFAGGIAWYEKSTGILINGYFPYAMGDYTLEFFNTNAVFSYVTPLSGLFEGLYMKYNYLISGLTIPVNTTYTGYSVNTYNTTFCVLSLPDGSWNDDTTTRIMSNVDVGPPSFLPATYTPLWIFTNASLGVNVTIGIASEGDHIFEVTNSIDIEFPGFGPISIWELEDLDGSGGIAWYEQNSGILLNGTFFIGGGPTNYSLSLFDTNANFGYLLPYSFTLSTNATDPDIDGIFDLEWTNSVFAEDYSIYEHSSYISEINGSLTPIALDTTNMTKHLSGYGAGEYYFIAVAENMAGSTLSNCIQITVEIPSSGGAIPGYSIFFLVLAGLSISLITLRKWKKIQK